MTKQQILNIIDDLIKDELEAIDGYHKAIDKMSDSPRAVSLFGHIYDEETRHITDLQELRKAVENHEEFMAEIERNKLFAMQDSCCGCYPDNDGIVFTEDKEDDNDKKKD